LSQEDSAVDEEVIDDVEEEMSVEEDPEETEEDAAQEQIGAQAATMGDNGTAADEIDVASFDELHLNPSMVEASQEAWRLFISLAASREAAGEAIYAALFDSAPSLQSLFTTPRAIQAMKFMNGLNQFVLALSDPPGLKVMIETLGFGHLALDVTVPRVVIFRDAILDLFQVELGSRLVTEAYEGWRAMLNYIGGAIIYIRTFYADRIRLLDESWTMANDKKTNKDKFATLGSMDAGDAKPVARRKSDKPDDHNGTPSETKQAGSMVQNVPTTFKDMFLFNAAVMGFGTNMWMTEVLDCFDNIVRNVSNSNRLVEECEVLVCRISKVCTGKVALSEFKACMLASLRSLLPKAWTTAHEVAWSWLWENVERTLMKNIGLPPVWEKAYGKFLDGVDEATGFQLRKDIYQKFFSLAPSGQDYFKQSNTYLHLIATKVLVMAIDMYRDPIRMVDDISALGLRHVGYAIPTEYMPPFATSCVEVMRGLTTDAQCLDGFQWSIGLISKSLVRTILEGSTIVMKAVNQNTKASMCKAISVAPRGERSSWMLMIQVGTQNISPLAWSIQSGALESASAMIKDLLTFRADRDKYYYSADEIFSRHQNIVKMLLNDAPSLLPELFDGLIWRSRLTKNGLRRVNYFLGPLMVDLDGRFHKTLEWVAKAKDPKLVCHPVLAVLSDILWSRIAMLSFAYQKSWFLCTLVLFIFSQAVAVHFDDLDNKPALLYTTLVVRALIYVCCMGVMVYEHVRRTIRAYRNPDTLIVRVFKIPVPSYLCNWQDAANMMLMCCLVVMLSSEPFVHCLQRDGGSLVSNDCPEADRLRFFPYSVFSMCAMFLYFALLIDLSVFNNHVSAYILVCGRMVGEVALFLVSVAIVILAAACGFSCLHQPNAEFKGIPFAAFALWRIFLSVWGDDKFEELYDADGNVPVILIGTYVFLLMTVIFFSNLLIAQLCCAYDSVYTNMVGYARLKRMNIIVESIPKVPLKRWESFVRSMAFEKRIEFNEGDVGCANGVATTEAAGLHPTTADRIRRFGGSTSPLNPWPAEAVGDEDGDKFERLENMIHRTLKKVNKSRGRHGSSSHGASRGPSGSAGGSGGSEMGSQAESEGSVDDN